MGERVPQLKEALQTVQGHVFYVFKDLNKYVDNVITYTVSGVEQGSHVLLIESTKLSPIIQQKLKAVLSKEQLSNVHFENNFDFYFSRGTFHVDTVLNHFMKSLEPYIEGEISIRIWGHAEWGSQKELDREMEKYENGADQILSLNKLTAVCSYNADRISESLRSSLIKGHGFLMTDNEIIKI